jgi:hypothetical protein
MNGAGWSNRICPETEAVLPAAAAARTASSASFCRCTVGTKCRSAFSEFAVGLTRIIPMPPTRATSKLFSMRALTPRSQSTILPAAATVSELRKHMRSGDPGAPNVTSWPVAEPVPADAPW